MTLYNPNTLVPIQAGVVPGGTLPGVGPQYVVNQPFGALPPGGTPNALNASPYQTTIPGEEAAPTLYQQLRNLTGTTPSSSTVPGGIGGVPTSTTSGLGNAPVLPGQIGGATATPSLGNLGEDAAEDAGGDAPGLFSRIAQAGPSGFRQALSDSEGGLADIGVKDALGGAASGFGGVAIPSIIGGIAGKAIGGKKGQVISDASTGLGLGGAAAGLGTTLGLESLAGPPGWILAGLTAIAGGAIGLWRNGGSTADKNHAAYQAGWSKINGYADDLGINNGNVISGAKDAYNALLQASSDPTNKKTQATALQQVQQSLAQYQTQRVQADQQSQNMLALQATGQAMLSPYLAASDRTGQSAQAAYGQLAALAPNPQARALAQATGAGFAASTAQQKAALVASTQSAPYEYQQQQSLINQYQQQIAAAALAKGQTSGL